MIYFKGDFAKGGGGLWVIIHNQVVADSNFKYVLEIKDVPKFKDART